jgi:hypothetical protein
MSSTFCRSRIEMALFLRVIIEMALCYFQLESYTFHFNNSHALQVISKCTSIRLP